MNQANNSGPDLQIDIPRASYRSRRVFWTLFISAFCSMLGIGIIVPFLPQYARDIGAEKLFYVGSIFAVMNLSRLIFLPVIRREAESGRTKKKTILIEGLIFYIILSIAYIWANNPLTLGIVRFFNGFASVMVLPISMAIIGELAPVMGEGREMGNYQMSVMLGFGAGPLIGGVIDDLFGYAAAFATMGFLNLIALLLVIFLLPEIKSSIKKDGDINWKPPTYRQALSSKVVMAVLIFRFINFVGRGASFTFIPVLAKDPRLNLSNTKVGIIISGIALVVGVFSGFFGRLADRYSRVNMVVFGSIGFTACITIMPLCHSFRSLFAAAMLSGIFGAVGIPASAAISVVEGRKYGMVTIMTLFEMATSLGMLFGPPVGGLVGDWAGLPAAFYFSGAVNFIGTFVFYWLMRNSESNIQPVEIPIIK